MTTLVSGLLTPLPPLHLAETVTLSGGLRVLLRPLTPADRQLYLAGFEHLSPESRFNRFLGPKPFLSEREVRYFTDVDHHDHEALAGVVGSEGVGVARYVRDQQDPRVADVAVAVVDEWQRRGIGSALMRLISERAREAGIERFRATLFWSNKPILAVIRRLGAPWRTSRASGGVLEVEIDLVQGGELSTLALA